MCSSYRIKRWAPWLAPLSLMLLVALAYAGVYGNSFVYDDEFLIAKNEYLRSWSYLGKIFLSNSTAGAGKIDSFFRPLQIFSYLTVFQLAGLSTTAFHLLNILLHAINATLVFFLGRRLALSLGVAWVAAALWAIHPVHSEAVAYMSGTADSLATAFVLLSALVLLPDFSWRRQLCALLLFGAGLLSKESIIVFPALVGMILFFTRFNSRWKPLTYLPSAPFWLLAFAYLAMRRLYGGFDVSNNLIAQPEFYTESALIRIYTFLATLPNYASILVWPANLSIDRPFPIFTDWKNAQVLMGSLILGGALFSVLFTKDPARKIYAWAALWFFAAYFACSGIVVPVNSFFLEHWLYLPSVSFFLALAYLASKITFLKGRNGAIVAGILIVALGTRTYMQGEVWKDPISLYSHILKFNPNLARVHNNLAMTYADQNRIDEAIHHYLEAIRLSDVYPETHHNLAICYLKLDKINEAEFHLRRAIELNPRFHFSYNILSQIAKHKGDLKAADEFSRQANEIRAAIVH